jgi:hypothetical protein
MVMWRAFAPVTIKLEDEQLECNEFLLTKYDEDKLREILEGHVNYWPNRHFDLIYKKGYWFKLEMDADTSQQAYGRLMDKTILIFETFALFKTTGGILLPAGLLVKGLAPHTNAHFGWENTITGKPNYLLYKTEYVPLLDFFIKIKKFWTENKVAQSSSEYLKRIYWAKYYFRKCHETLNLNERYIFLSIASEALRGLESELRYRFANRAALLLGDDIIKRKRIYKFILHAYDVRSKIVHGDIKWKIEFGEVLEYTEIIRQMILRSISLYANNQNNIGETLDDCLHDPKLHDSVLKDSKELFGFLSEEKAIEDKQNFKRILSFS